LWAVVALAGACGSFPNPKAKVDPNADAGVDDAFVGFDADLPDAFAYLDGPVVDGAPQGTPPTAGTVTVSGTTDVGKTLTIADAGWDLGSPAGTYHYKWERCSTSSCSSVATIGGDSTTYTLVSADAGYYIRGGVYAVNMCASGCGQTATVFSSAHGPVRKVTLSKGASCQGSSGCSSSACRILHVSVSGFSGSQTVTCDASNVTTNPWFTYTTSSFPSDRCCFGYTGPNVWVTVGGLKSNVVSW
jgi:hypothetical protein